jgi:hypothetical protein
VSLIPSLGSIYGLGDPSIATQISLGGNRSRDRPLPLESDRAQGNPVKQSTPSSATPRIPTMQASDTGKDMRIINGDNGDSGCCAPFLPCYSCRCCCCCLEGNGREGQAGGGGQQGGNNMPREIRPVTVGRDTTIDTEPPRTAPMRPASPRPQEGGASCDVAEPSRRGLPRSATTEIGTQSSGLRLPSPSCFCVADPMVRVNLWFGGHKRSNAN